MKIKRIDIVKRQGGFFHLQDRKVRAYRKGDGFAVDIVLEASQIDCDIGNLPTKAFQVLTATIQEFHFFITAKDLKRIELLMDKSDNLTFELIGHGWDHPERPFHKLEEFVRS